MGKRVSWMGFLAGLVLLQLGPWLVRAQQEAATAPPSGRLVSALLATPPHLDVMSDTTSVVGDPANHIYEGLFAWSDGFRPIPMLVDIWDVDTEGNVWTFTLRQGVLFHNGDEMTVNDVEASFNRWVQVSRQGRTYADVTFEKIDSYSFWLVSSETRADILENFSAASQALVIMPAEIADAAGANEITDPNQFIGTGPFEFVELVPNESVLLRSFPDYVGRGGPPDGDGDGKVALVAELEFRIITDVPTLTAAFQAGEIDVVSGNIPGIYKPTFEADPNVVVQVVPGTQKWGPVFNFNSAVFNNRLNRQAVAAAMDHEELALTMTGDPELFDINPGLAFEGSFFYNEAGAEFFDVRDQDRARELLAESGYDGEEIVIISTKASIFMDRLATVLAAQLQDVGMNVRIDWYDGATLRQARTQLDLWDIIPGGWGTTFNPGVYGGAFRCDSDSWSGFCDPALDEIFIRAARIIDLDERAEVYEELQQAIIETHVPQVLIGDFQAFLAYRSNVTSVRAYKIFRAWGVAKQ